MTAKGTGPRILLVTSNGAGMGHLSRQLAVGLAAGDTAECTLFSLSLGLPVVLGFGIAGEYCPSYDREWMPKRSWNSYLRDRIVAIAEELAIDVLLFDGVAPYPGIANARRLLPDVAFVWSRRGMWQPATSSKQLKRSATFDLIVEPGDLASAADRGPTAERGDAVRIAPVSLLEVFPLLPRVAAAERLGLDPERRTALVTLGSGRLGDVKGPGRVVVEALLEDREWQIGITRAAIAVDGIDPGASERVVEIAGVFPLARYLGAFDVAISAAGYNAVHELIPAGLPSLLVANSATRTDDQIARASHLAAIGLALSAAEDDPAGLHSAVRSLGDPAVRESLKEACASVPRTAAMGGATRTGELAVSLASGFVPSRKLRAQRVVRTVDERLRQYAKDRLGPAAVDRIRTMLGRTPEGGIPASLAVRVTSDEGAFLAGSGSVPAPLLVTERPTVAAVRAGPPLEHLLAGTSDEYRTARLEIVRRYFDADLGEVA